MITKLHLLSEIRTGYTFRGRIASEHGIEDVAVLQPRDIEKGELLAEPTMIDGSQVQSLNNHLLRPGDILLSNKGTKFSSFLIDGDDVKRIASASFFVIKAYPKAISPKYLAWFLSQKPALNYLSANASGVTITSLTKKALEGLPVAVPPVHVQESIVAMADLVKREQRELLELIEKREEYKNAFCWELINRAS
ncbi:MULTISPECIES: restriction endonuclease subunit S [unclassified Imperialibacter]|uniref:restriction endonuclease subunit S n=1 Tax=unclassified Imperialibacter TaxID=2629706 RepID=UPI00125849F7|nr:MULTISPECIES: restriction endonuclease subunit S [unclassified Imperialibacter]CAD5248168.1 conserved hypothetical protein [Imperialibacter sp. 75]CAD5248289.1 conserved hypothetical protein [Imperialibacter sp. 89]VVS97536.1 conserved hypothetical protein [Imperialibacter sp. EC-SDR9]